MQLVAGWRALMQVGALLCKLVRTGAGLGRLVQVRVCQVGACCCSLVQICVVWRGMVPFGETFLKMVETAES